MSEYRYMEELMERYECLKPIEEDIKKAYETLKNAYITGGKLLIAGNGGSCADSEHIVGELMKGFVKKRPITDELSEKMKQADPERGDALSGKLQQGLPAIALTGHPGLTTAFLNDVDPDMVFAQQLLGYGKQGDVFMGLTTSGNSKNILYAVTVAKAKGMSVIGLAGRDGGELKRMADTTIVVPEEETYKIQELHLPVYHTLCLMLEDYFFKS